MFEGGPDARSRGNYRCGISDRILPHRTQRRELGGLLLRLNWRIAVWPTPAYGRSVTKHQKPCARRRAGNYPISGHKTRIIRLQFDRLQFDDQSYMIQRCVRTPIRTVNSTTAFEPRPAGKQ